jgi:hypothetical protein
MEEFDLWRYLLALTALDLCIDLVSARVEQLDGLILQFPHVAVVTQIGIVCIDPLAWD